MAKHNLIVDEPVTMRKTIMRIRHACLGSTDFKEAAIEGRKPPETSKFDLILSDVDMPNMNGLDFIEAAKK